MFQGLPDIHESPFLIVFSLSRISSAGFLERRLPVCNKSGRPLGSKSKKANRKTNK